jgi:hypothetical protein
MTRIMATYESNTPSARHNRSRWLDFIREPFRKLGFDGLDPENRSRLLPPTAKPAPNDD